MAFCTACGTELLQTNRFCAVCGTQAGSTSESASRNFVAPPPRVAVDVQYDVIRQVADYERISGILWLILGILQVISVFGIIAGVWNILAGISRIRLVRRIQARDPRVVAAFSGMAGLIVIGVINLLIGGVIGVIFVAFDFYVRDKVLSNAQLFDADPYALA